MNAFYERISKEFIKDWIFSIKEDHPAIADKRIQLSNSSPYFHIEGQRMAWDALSLEMKEQGMSKEQAVTYLDGLRRKLE